MIPQAIKHNHVLQAITQIRTGGVPRKREPTKFNLVYDGRLYPPKFVLSLAAKFATGIELAASEFSGGDEANSFLADLGFEIQAKRDDWSWKECYFAIWAYDQLDQDHAQVKNVLYREVAELQGPMTQDHAELLACHAGGYGKAALPGIHTHTEAAKLSVSQDAPIRHGAAQEQGFTDQYNRHQSLPGKTRTKSSENRCL